jgi:hypothetical protein
MTGFTAAKQPAQTISMELQRQLPSTARANRHVASLKFCLQEVPALPFFAPDVPVCANRDLCSECHSLGYTNFSGRFTNCGDFGVMGAH